jgi:membrane fusion protein, multidrug efflux system
LISFCNSHFRSRWALAAILIALVFGGFFGWSYLYGDGAGSAVPGAAKPAVVPVTTAQAQTADFPVYLNGLGTVEPYDTVTVRSRVDGQVVTVAFKQGQMVKEPVETP